MNHYHANRWHRPIDVPFQPIDLDLELRRGKVQNKTGFSNRAGCRDGGMRDQEAPEKDPVGRLQDFSTTFNKLQDSSTILQDFSTTFDI